MGGAGSTRRDASERVAARLGPAKRGPTVGEWGVFRLWSKVLRLEPAGEDAAVYGVRAEPQPMQV